MLVNLIVLMLMAGCLSGVIIDKPDWCNTTVETLALDPGHSNSWCVSVSDSCSKTIECHDDMVTKDCKCMENPEFIDHGFSICDAYWNDTKATPDCAKMLMSKNSEDYCGLGKAIRPETCGPDVISEEVHVISMGTVNGKDDSYIVSDMALVYEEDTNDIICTGNKAASNEDHNMSPNFSAPIKCFAHPRSKKIVAKIHNVCDTAVKCIGKRSIVYYGWKKISEMITGECDNCWSDCERGVVRIRLSKGIKYITACTNLNCKYYEGDLGVIDHLLSQDERTVRSNVAIRIYDEQKNLIKDDEIVCPKEEFCDTIPCWFCSLMIRNPRCIPWYLWIVYISITMGLGFSMKTIIFYMKKASDLTGVSWAMKKGKKKFVNWKNSKKASNYTNVIYRPTTTSTDDVELVGIETPDSQTDTSDMGSNEIINENQPTSDVTSQRRTMLNKKARAMTLMSLILILTCGVEAEKVVKRQHGMSSDLSCSNFDSYIVKDESCSITKNSMSCVISNIMIMKISEGGTGCFVISHEDGSVLGELKVSVAAHQMHCTPSIQYFTKPTDVTVYSAFRCSGAGSCHKGAEIGCGGVKPGDWVSEIEDNAWGSIGTTHCMATAGCAANGCFYCTNACLYWREKWIVSSSKPAYVVSKCVEWIDHITLNIETITADGIKTDNTYSLNKNQKISVGNGAFQVWYDDTASFQAPVLSSTFVSTQGKVALMTASEVSNPLSGEVGDVQCNTEDKLSQTNIDKSCQYAKDRCRCHDAGRVVRCECAQNRIESRFLTSNKLPLLMENGKISGTKYDDVIFDVGARNPFELKIKTMMRLKKKETKPSCTGEFKSVSGCYNCLKGAQLDFTCISSNKAHTTTLKCTNITAAITCMADSSRLVSVRFTPYSQKINEYCSVECPKGGFQFHASGLLDYAELPDGGGEVVDPPIDNTPGSNWPDIEIPTAWWQYIKLIGLVISALTLVGISISLVSSAMKLRKLA